MRLQNVKISKIPNYMKCFKYFSTIGQVRNPKMPSLQQIVLP